MAAGYSHRLPLTAYHSPLTTHLLPLLFSFLYHINYIFQVAGRNLLLLGKKRDHLLVRIGKVVTDKAAHERPFVFAFADGACSDTCFPRVRASHSAYAPGSSLPKPRWYRAASGRETWQVCPSRNILPNPRCTTSLLLLVLLTFPWNIVLV